MKKDRFQQMKDQMNKNYSNEIINLMQKEYDNLCKTHTDLPDSFVSHARNNIFPVAATFKALIQSGYTREKAAEIARENFLVLMEETAGSIRKMLKVPGLYKCIPWIFKTAMPKLFREDAGFRFRFKSKEAGRAQFDMLECPYLNMCRELDCMEIAETFCATDDICYGKMHPKLIWNRTKTLARGGDLCDFDLYTEKKNKK